MVAKYVCLFSNRLALLSCSKLTRLLKDGLSGNSRTIMLATVSSSADQYHHTTNTLKYADRAKEIKTHIQVHNLFCINSHVCTLKTCVLRLKEFLLLCTDYPVLRKCGALKKEHVH
jgi:hypothetical protein